MEPSTTVQVASRACLMVAVSKLVHSLSQPSTRSFAFKMRGLLYLLAVARVAAAQGNLTVQTLKDPPIPSTTEEPLFSVAGGAHPTCEAVTIHKTHYVDKPYTLTVTQPKETITTTCTETTTVHDTKTYTSTTTCTVVSSIPFRFTAAQRADDCDRPPQHQATTSLKPR